MTDTQLDLFGQVEAREQRAAAEQRQREDQAAARQARIDAFRARATIYPDGTPVIWTAPYDTAGGMKEGDTKPGWWCWICGQVNSNEFMLQLNHGLTVADTIVHQRTYCTNDIGGIGGYSRESWELRAHSEGS